MNRLTIRDYVRISMIWIRYQYLTRVCKMDISPIAFVSFGAKLDRTNPRGVHIGDESYVASGAIIFSHDYCKPLHGHTYIGRRCFIGANAIISCGVAIGDEVIVGAGAVVTRDIPSHCIVAGNPARIIREGIRTKRYGQLIPTINGTDE